MILSAPPFDLSPLYLHSGLSFTSFFRRIASLYFHSGLSFATFCRSVVSDLSLYLAEGESPTYPRNPRIGPPRGLGRMLLHSPWMYRSNKRGLSISIITYVVYSSIIICFGVNIVTSPTLLRIRVALLLLVGFLSVLYGVSYCVRVFYIWRVAHTNTL